MPYVESPAASIYDATTEKSESMDIAIVGLSCRLAGDARTPEDFWKLLIEGRGTRTKTDRFNLDAFQAPDGVERLNTSSANEAHFLQQDIAAFDAGFFNIPQNEAVAMDPHQRLMLEVTYEAFENAGLHIQDVAGSQTSCYVGQFCTDYREIIYRDPETAPMYAITGTGTALASNRLSWFYDLKGESYTLNTACSSGLVALHAACQSLRTGESKMAVVGGTNLILSPEMFLHLTNQHFLAKDGNCKTFDEFGDGYGRGEGVAALIIKPVRDAVRDGDPIRAVIRGTGVNQNGRTKGITLPSASAQADLIRQTYKMAGLGFQDTGYVETHGTGTKVGDPLELEAIAETLTKTRDPSKKIIIGSSKPNIGHTEATAGLAAIIKGVYILETATIPPNIYLNTPNPAIPWDEWKVTAPTKMTPWPTEGIRRMSVNSTGYSGTNAHAILDDALSYLENSSLDGIHYTKPFGSAPRAAIAEAASEADVKRVYAFSAQDQDGVRRQQETLAKHLKDISENGAKINGPYLESLAFTLSDKRSRLPWKGYAVADTFQNLCAKLEDKEMNVTATRSTGKQPRLGFVFTGQGAQWAKMGMELLQYPVFRKAVEEADEFYRTQMNCKWSALEEMNRDDKTSRISLPEFSQPLCTVLQIALVDLLETWNIRCVSATGHSSGEIAAAYSVGALNKEDSWRIAYMRGILSAQIPELFPELKGCMMAVGSSQAEAQKWIAQTTKGTAVVACVNSPQSVTISGDLVAIDELEAIIKETGVFARKLKVSTAYHSPHMNNIAKAYLESLSNIETHHDEGETRRMYSSLAGGFVEHSELGATHWVSNLTSAVLFNDALAKLVNPVTTTKTETDVEILVELGPHAALQGPIKEILKEHGVNNVEYISLLTRGRSGVDTALAAAGELFVRGYPVKFSQANTIAVTGKQQPLQLINLPMYAWNHTKTYWAESRVGKEFRQRKYGQSALLGAPCPSMGEAEKQWRSHVRLNENPWIRDHKIQSAVVYPAAGYIAMAVEATRRVADQGRKLRDIKLRDIQISAAAMIEEDAELEMILELRPHLMATRDKASAWYEFSIATSSKGSGLRQNCSGLVAVEYEAVEESSITYERKLEDEAAREQYSQLQTSCKESIDTDRFYEGMNALGLGWGPAFKRMSQIQIASNQACVQVNAFAPEGTSFTERPFTIHPTTLDGMIHAAFAAYQSKVSGAMVPKFIAEVTISANAPCENDAEYKGFSTTTQHGLREFLADITMMDATSLHPAVKINGMCCTALAGMDATESGAAARTLCSKVAWTPSLELLSTDQLEQLLTTPAKGELSSDLARAVYQRFEDDRTADLLDKKAYGEEVEAVFENYDDARCQQVRMMASTAGKFGSDVEEFTQFIILENAQPSEEAQAIAEALENALGNESMAVERLSWDEAISAPDFEGNRYISLLELEKPILAESTADDFGAIRSLLLESASLLWVSVNNPNGNLATGLIRTIRNEVPGLDLRTLQVQQSSLADAEALAGSVTRIAVKKTTDDEFIEEDGILKVSRIFKDGALDERIVPSDASKSQIDQLTLKQVKGAHKLGIQSQGLLDTLCYEFDDALKANLPEDEVEIEVKATSLNFRDVMVAMGNIPDNTIGFEASGVITRVGAKVTDFAVGDNVCTLGHGAHTSIFQNKAALCQRMPEGLSFGEAASLPLVHCTAYNALVRIARAEQGQSVLIHAAAGGVGQVAVQIAKHIGLEIYATVGSAEKRQLLKETYGLTDDRIFSSRDVSFAKGVMRATNGRGVDIILNSLSGEMLRQTWNCIAPFGTFIEIGLKDILANTGLEMKPFLQDATFSFFNISHIMSDNVKLMARIMNDTFDFLRQGVTRPVFPMTTYSIANVENAFRLMQTGKHRGKIVLEWDTDVVVPIVRSAGSALQLEADATYILFGGFGGLGRSLALHLAERGARHLAVFSRSGLVSTDAKKVAATLEAQGVTVKSYSCDIADATTFGPTMAQLRSEMPPVRGAIQGAMALRDSSFEKMTHTQWVESLRPKVAGTWNIHAELPADIDFFIMLSSFTGILGSRSQSNYAAGNTFLDGMAHHRRSLGLKAASLDLGIMKEVGSIAENGSGGHLKEWEEDFGVTEGELHQLMDHIITSQTVGDTSLGAQLLTGFASGGAAAAAGIQRPFYFDDARFSILAQTDMSTSSGSSGGQTSVAELLATADSLPTAVTLVTAALVARVAKSLQVSATEIDANQPLHVYGVDSLVAIEFRNWIFKDMASNVPLFDILAAIPMSGLAEKIALKSTALPAGMAVAA